jgi:acetolactate synthase-1/2/3 large subunit
MKLTGSEVVTEMLVREGVPYAVGIPGHGCLPLVDAFRRNRDRIGVIMPRHEQSAVHIADGYFRVKGEPLAAFTSIGAGAANTAIGLATAYADSVPVLLLIGEAHTYMRGMGILQEIERQRGSDLPRMFDPVVKRRWDVSDAAELPRAVSQAFNAMLAGRPGPAVIGLPMDVQAQTVNRDAMPEPQSRRPHDRPRADAGAIRQAAELLVSAKRPVIIAGGGVLLSHGESALLRLAEHVGACVVTTMQGKSAFPEKHPLYAWHMGSNGTTCGNHMTANADVILAVGVRFADKATSSYRQGISFNIPPTLLIHADIDPFEIGKNYPVELGIVADAKATLEDLAEAVGGVTSRRGWEDAPYTREIAERVRAWSDSSRHLRESDAATPTMGRVIAEVRNVLPPDAIVLTSSGNSQAHVFQEMPFTRPRTYLSAGGFSTMGWSLPAAIGAKLAAPDVPVVAMVGDGDFLMTVQELATAVQYGIAVVAVVMNNQGWQSIRDLQRLAFSDDSAYATMFERAGEPITPHIADVARAFGAHAARVSAPEEVAPAVRAAVESGRPAVVEAMIDMAIGSSGGQAPGWWDVPVPTYLTDRRDAYEREKQEERF